MAVKYDKDTDYMALMNESKAKGNMQAYKIYEEKRNAKINDLNKTNTNTNSYTSTSSSKGKDSSTPTYNEHAQYIQQVYPGGLDAYTKLQNDRYNTAYQNKDYDLLQRLDQDALRVGYSLGVPQQPQQQVQPQVMPQTDYSQQMNDLLSAVQNYQGNMPNMPYPDMGDYKFNNIQNQLSSLTNEVQNYKGADYMNMDEAIARANSQLGGMYNQTLEQALESYNKNAISRGMFGQMPVEALKQNAIAENELNKSNAVNSFGADMYSKDFNMAQQKNNDYYAQINRLSDLLGQQYNTELDKYQGDVGQYTNYYNTARQQDKDYFDNIYRQIDILGTKQNMQTNEMDRYSGNIGQFSNDYMAEINRVKGDNDPTNDWKISYLNNARNQKISGQNSAQADSQNQQYKQAMDMFGKLGYASGWIADILGVPEGTTTASYANILADNARIGSGGGSDSGDSETEVFTIAQKQALYDDALALLKIQNPYKENFTQAEIEEAYNYVYKLRMSDPADMALQNDLEDEITRRTMTSDIKAGSLPGLNAIDGGSLYDLFK